MCMDTNFCLISTTPLFGVSAASEMRFCWEMLLGPLEGCITVRRCPLFEVGLVCTFIGSPESLDSRLFPLTPRGFLSNKQKNA